MKQTSIFFCLFFAIAANLFTTAKAQINTTDSLALVDLYNSTNGPNWTHHDNWLTTQPVSQWYGIGVDSNRVVNVYIRFNNLKGTLPTSIGNLTSLIYLFLDRNHLSGSIPSTLGNCTALTYLILYNNNLSGKIPSSIGNLTNLYDLDLDNNHLSGAIPSSFGNLTALVYLFLNRNHLSGTIPASLGNLTKVYDLWLNDNKLRGTVPISLVEIKKLNDINLSFNQLSALQYADIDTNTNPKLEGNLNNNLFTFDGMQIIAKRFHRVYYAPQNTILPIHQNGNTLSVYAGGNVGKNTYYWFKAGSTDTTIITGDSTFTPSTNGQYYAKVTNAIATQLTLYSDTIDYTMSSIAINNRVAADVKDKRFSVYPNPARDVIHLQTTGNATIILSNADGKVLLTKTISNNDVINVSKYVNGIYYIKNTTTGEVQKIVVVH